MAVTVKDLSGNKPRFAQWETDRVLEIAGMSVQPVLRFACGELTRALVVVAEETETENTWTAKVPNVLLQYAGPLFLSVIEDGDEQQEVFSCLLAVHPRMKPQDYAYTENIGYINWVEKAAEVQAILDDAHDWQEDFDAARDAAVGQAESAIALAKEQAAEVIRAEGRSAADRIADDVGAAIDAGVGQIEAARDTALGKISLDAAGYVTDARMSADSAAGYATAAADSAAQVAAKAASLTLDETLSKSGQAAEAKATGDAIRLIGDVMDAFLEPTTITGTGAVSGEIDYISSADVGNARGASIGTIQRFEAKLPGNTSETTVFGMRYTKNDDGTYTFDGTATADAWFHLSESSRTGYIGVSVDGWTSFGYDIVSGDFVKSTYEGDECGLVELRDKADYSTPLASLTLGLQHDHCENYTSKTGIVGFRVTTGVTYNNLRIAIKLYKGKTLYPYHTYKPTVTVYSMDGPLPPVEVLDKAREYTPYIAVNAIPSTEEITISGKLLKSAYRARN